MNLVGIASAFGFFFGVIFLAVTIRGLTTPPNTNTRETTAPPVVATRSPPVRPAPPPTPVETIDSRAQGAMAAVVGYLNAEQRLLPREQYWCSTQEMPGRFHNLIDWRMRPDYVRQLRANPVSLPEWFLFTVDIRASNALGGVLAGVRSYYVKRFTDGTYRLIGQCEDDVACDGLRRLDGFVYTAGQAAPCAFPRDEAAPSAVPTASGGDAAVLEATDAGSVLDAENPVDGCLARCAAQVESCANACARDQPSDFRRCADGWCMSRLHACERQCRPSR